MKPRQMYVYDGEITVTYEPVAERGGAPTIRLTGGTSTHQYTITAYGKGEIERLTDALLAIRSDLAIRKPQTGTTGGY